jgi:hypothetical protein
MTSEEEEQEPPSEARSSKEGLECQKLEAEIANEKATMDPTRLLGLFS